jgi:hypothetical protein
MGRLGSAWPDVFDALLTRMRARVGYRAPNEWGDAGIPVYDSVESSDSSDDEAAVLVIGWTGDPDDTLVEPSGSITQGRATMGTSHHRNDSGRIGCLIDAYQGEAELSDGTTAPNATGLPGSARTRAFAVLDDLADELRLDPALGLKPTYSSVVIQIGSVDAVAITLSGGVRCRLLFTVTFDARI